MIGIFWKLKSKIYYWHEARLLTRYFFFSLHIYSLWLRQGLDPRSNVPLVIFVLWSEIITSKKEAREYQSSVWTWPQKFANEVSSFIFVFMCPVLIRMLRTGWLFRSIVIETLLRLTPWLPSTSGSRFFSLVSNKFALVRSQSALCSLIIVTRR